ncbi:MAG: Tn3 family transposase, partial [Pseudomonadota bacterium]
IDAVTAHIEKCNKRSALILLDTVGKKWREGLTSDDEGRVIKTASAAGAIIIKRLLKNGSLGVVHSIEHRNPETRLIPKDQWEQSQARYIRNLGLTKNVGTYLKHLKPVLRAGLDQLALAIRQGDLTIKDGRLIVPRLQSAQTSPEVGVVRRRLFDMIGEAQLPDVLINVDAATGFSSKLLGRPARSDKELVTLYASTLALGTDLTAASAARMVAGVEAKAIARMMARLVASGTLPAANRAVLEFAAAHDIAKLWGPGTTASSDMMSLEASRHLWSTRIDPRRRSYSIGAYTHVLDQWSIIYDQPIVLNRRQAGAAIEGALRQTTTTIDRLAVDTHGHTHFAMALAKCCGFDLCPRLAGLHNRKLYLPKGFMVPNELKDIVSPSISTRTIANGWDGLLRLASSVQQGWVPATFAMDRFGSAAKGDPIYEAGVGLGKLLLTLYLCDYLTKEDFQREIGRLLSQGESIHILQRAIHSKPLGAKTGRDIEELTAISNALTLLTKIVVAWNTASMEQVIKSAPADWRQEHVRHIAPIAHAHINLRGVMTFDLGKHRDNPFGGEQNKKAHSENVKPNLQINSTP